MSDDIDKIIDNIDDTIDKTDKWYTIKEAAEILNISERTVWRRKKEGKIKFRFKKGTCYFKIDDAIVNVDTDIVKDIDAVAISALIEQLQSENERLIQELSDLRNELKRKEETHKQELQQKDALLEQNRNRQDTIILQLTRQLEQSQRLLGYQEPWYRKLFRRKQRNDLS